MPQNHPNALTKDIQLYVTGVIAEVINMTTFAIFHVSKLPIRQLTKASRRMGHRLFSKLPIRQLTASATVCAIAIVSKLPIRQLTIGIIDFINLKISKLPIRQLT